MLLNTTPLMIANASDHSVALMAQNHTPSRGQEKANTQSLVTRCTETLTQLASSLAIGMVILFSGVQLWWAIESLQQIRQAETAGKGPAVSGVFNIVGEFTR